MSGDWGSPVSAWSSSASCCGECGETFAGGSCPGCGESPEAAPLSIYGFVWDRGDETWLTVAESTDSGWSVLSERPISDEQAEWVLRQGDVR